jgi:hypothetical protein
LGRANRREQPGKVMSLFEPHSEIIGKGKLAKPTEFGRLVEDPGS